MYKIKDLFKKKNIYIEDYIHIKQDSVYINENIKTIKNTEILKRLIKESYLCNEIESLTFHFQKCSYGNSILYGWLLFLKDKKVKNLKIICYQNSMYNEMLNLGLKHYLNIEFKEIKLY